MPPHPVSFARLLTLCGCWWAVVTGHFMLCGWLAWKMIARPNLPPFLKSVDPLLGSFGYGIATGLEFAWMLLWWCLVGLTFWGSVKLVRWADQSWLWWHRIDPVAAGQERSAVGSSAVAMWPVLTLSLLNLLILPAGAANQPSSPTGLETAAALNWDNWNLFLVQSLPVMAGFGLLMTTVLLLSNLIPSRVQGCLSMTLFFGAIIAGISVMGGWIWLTRDLFVWLPRHVGYASTTALFFLAVTLLVCLPMLIVSRRRARPW